MEKGTFHRDSHALPAAVCPLGASLPCLPHLERCIITVCLLIHKVLLILSASLVDCR